MNDSPSSYTSFRELGGRMVGVDELQHRLSELQLDLVLGVLSRISAHHVRDGDAFFSPLNQGPYLNGAIADDFPEQLPGASTMYAPGRVPLTGGRHLFIHEHGMLALAKQAILHCRTDKQTTQVTRQDIGHVARLLLIANDHLALEELSEDRPPDVRTRRLFAIHQLYYGQFNRIGGALRGPIGLARLHVLLKDHLPSYLPDLAEKFRSNVGIELDRYLHVAALLSLHTSSLSGQLSPSQSAWIATDWRNAVKNNADEVQKVVDLFAKPPSFFREREADAGDLFDFNLLQSAPYVEARPGELIAPVFSLVIRQVLSFPLQQIAALDGGKRALGKAFEDYAHSLVDRIALADARGPWQIKRGLVVKSKQPRESGELDSVLWRDGVAVLFEHKAGHLILTLGSRKTLRNALGPTDEELDNLPTPPRKDQGAITHGIWQYSRVERSLTKSLENCFGGSSTKVFPMITTLEGFLINARTRKFYFSSLMAACDVKLPPASAPIDWLTVEGLEALAQLAESNELDLLNFLSSRADHPSQFERHLANRHGVIPVDMRLTAIASELTVTSHERYFGGTSTGESAE